MAAPRRTSCLLSAALLSAGLLLALQGSTAFVPAAARGGPSAEAVALGLTAPALLGASAAVAGEPPSVGDHWYWDLGFGSLHGETASIILLVFFLYLGFALIGAGGSSRKAA
ncbi:unnamed protein product [Prorocentrum cordatum]|uniref:Uncharacterized protein n=1 Tax=Prorocentrum cordatum TaxID=2364126 RepID=A0ABN9VV94_9DINO|nr:unnamed protein product [Polarella glacialis]CAK0898812.1 unnamed protein product [Polarella glacialis]